MDHTSQPDIGPPAAGTLDRVRRLLLATFVAGAAGTGIELLLIGHYEDWQQFIPLVLLGSGLCAMVWHATAGTASSIRVLQALMLLFLASGAFGVVFHYEGNVEFELEMYPSMAGVELFTKTMTGATPVLAPGTMVVLGLVGMGYAWGRDG